MNKHSKIEHLEQALQSLKDKFTNEATYSETRLQELQRNASDNHQKSESFYCLGARDMANQLQQKLAEGWTYIDHQASVLQHQNLTMHIQLRKPEDILTTELVQLDESVRTQYLEDIEQLKPNLIAEIAKVNLQIKKLQLEIKADTKQEAEFTKELQRVTQELLNSADPSEEAPNEA